MQCMLFDRKEIKLETDRGARKSHASELRTARSQTADGQRKEQHTRSTRKKFGAESR